MSEQPCYTLIYGPTESEQPSETQLKDSLEKGDVKAKSETLQKLIKMLLSGEKLNQGLVMYVIRFCLPSQDHLIKKLLLIFWEIIPKTSSDGKLLQEMILVCDAYRRDLQHSNEFIRGSTLRFLCKLKESELLEPLMPAIRTCLEHRHSYVRRNAVLAIFTIYRNFEFLIPDAPELVYNFLEAEQDMSCKRNAFLMLLHVDQQRALDYLSGCIEQVTSFGEILQLVIVELIYKVCHTNPNERSRFIRCVYNLLQSSSAAVRYEAAGTLVTLTTAPSAIRAAATCYIDLIVKESDNNVKLIVLDRLIQLKSQSSNEKIMQDLIMDILRVLSSPDLEVRRKTLKLALELVSSRNVSEMVMFLKKEISRMAGSVDQDDTDKYKQLLVRTLHTASIKFPDVAETIIPVLLEFLGDSSELAAGDVLVFIREAVQSYEHMRARVVSSLLEAFPVVRKLKIFRGALWIIGEYCNTVNDIQSAMTLIRQSLGALPIVDDEMKLATDETKDEDTQLANKVKQLVTADGTYATQSALSSVRTKIGEEKPAMRQFLLDGEFFVGAALGSVLIKLVLRYQSLVQDVRKQNQFAGEAMFILASIIHLGKSGLPKKGITEDDLDRLALCVRILADKCPISPEIFLNRCRNSLDMMLQVQAKEELLMKKSELKEKASIQADTAIGFTQLSKGFDAGGGENLFEASLSQALGHTVLDKDKAFDFSTSKLGKITQLTGFSDPVYAEAYVNVNQYDIVLDVLVVNQTNDTMEALTLELATLGDLKLVEKPQPITLAPHDFSNIKANVKVASTENGIIFGSIVYDVHSSTTDRNVVFLNDIHVDIMDYIVPASCTDQEFRTMWAEFEWENKVTVNTPLSDLKQYLNYLLKATNMRSLTPEAALTGDCGFLAANLYAHSIFGEDALANVSIERPEENDAVVTGHIRIRAKSQGMALSLGDKINNAQKNAKKVFQQQNEVAE